MKEYVISRDREDLIQGICLEELGKAPAEWEMNPSRVIIRFKEDLTANELKKLKTRIQRELQMYVSEREVTRNER